MFFFFNRGWEFYMMQVGQRFVQVKITLFRRCHQRHTLASRRVAVTIISLLHLMSLTDVLGFDPAVRCHLLSLALAWCLFSFPLPLSLLHFTIPPSPFLVPLFPFSSLYISSFSSSSSFNAATACRFCVCLPDGGRKRSRKFICRDVAPYSKTRMIYLHGAEGETDEMDLLEKGLSSVTRGGGGRNVKCIFWKKRANPLSKPCGSSSIVFALVRPMNSPGFRAWLRNVRREFERDLFRRGGGF